MRPVVYQRAESLRTWLGALNLGLEEGWRKSEAKHVVDLMLENRSFDHVYGWLYGKGVRGHSNADARKQPLDAALDPQAKLGAANCMLESSR